MKLDADVRAALEDAFENMPVPQSEEFQRRFRKLCENALIANQAESEVRRVIDLLVVETEEES
jgi:hypothetical protein